MDKKEKLDKYFGGWDFFNMFTSLELGLLIVATIVVFGVLYSILSLF